MFGNKFSDWELSIKKKSLSYAKSQIFCHNHEIKIQWMEEFGGEFQVVLGPTWVDPAGAARNQPPATQQKELCQKCRSRIPEDSCYHWANYVAGQIQRLLHLYRQLKGALNLCNFFKTFFSPKWTMSFSIFCFHKQCKVQLLELHKQFPLFSSPLICCWLQ